MPTLMEWYLILRQHKGFTVWQSVRFAFWLAMPPRTRIARDADGYWELD